MSHTVVALGVVGHGARLGALGGRAGAEGRVAALGRLAARLVRSGVHELARLRLAAWALRWTARKKKSKLIQDTTLR